MDSLTPIAEDIPVARFGDGVWLIRGLVEARQVLADDDAFRAASPQEFVQGFSRSFFLATDTGTPEDRGRFRKALATAVSPRRDLLATVWSEIRDMAERGELEADGLPGYALQRQIITVEEAPMLTIPLLEMAVLDMSGALTLAAVQAVSLLSPTAQRQLTDAQSCRAAVWEAARRLDDIYITRVATKSAKIGNACFRPNDRILIEVLAVNTDGRFFPNAREFDPARDSEHLAFGHGKHVCMGRELAMGTAVVGLHELLLQGTLVVPAGGAAGTLRLVSHNAAEPDQLQLHG